MITLTCSIGKFIFDNEIPLSIAKLIRDTVMDQFWHPADGRWLKNGANCLSFVNDKFPNYVQYLVDVEIHPDLVKG